MFNRFSKYCCVLFCTFLVSIVSTNATSLLDEVKRKGFVTCGVSQGLSGFSNPNNRGEWQGLDADLCRAIATAVLGDKTKVRFYPTSSKTRFTALQSKEIDVLIRNTTWSMQRDTALGIDFVAVNYYDGQGFMINKSLGISNARELGGASLCTNAGTTTELNVADYFRSNGMKYEINTYDKADESVAAYASGRCDVYTTDHSALHVYRLKMSNPDDHVILPEVISKEPLGPVVRQGDDQWADIVAWVHYAMINAEELGVTSKNVKEMYASSKNPAINRLLGKEGAFGHNLDISNLWAYNIVEQIGNYGEVFERHLGMRTPLKIARGQNALWRDGGLQYAPPIR